MKIGFVTNSTSDLPGAIIEQHELEVIPCILVLDGKEYVDGVDITREEFYKQLPTFPHSMPITTAAPSIGEFNSRYESLFSRGYDHILSIHAAGALTSIISSARQAAQDFEREDHSDRQHLPHTGTGLPGAGRGGRPQSRVSRRRWRRSNPPAGVCTSMPPSPPWQISNAAGVSRPS